MKLCRYFDENGLDVLQNLRLKVSDPSKFNDPFEFLPSITGSINKKSFKISLMQSDRLFYKLKNMLNLKNKEELITVTENPDFDVKFNQFAKNYPNNLLKVISDTKKNLAEEIGVLCFTNFDAVKPHDEMLMWGHYTKNHSGLRITFDTKRLNVNSNNLIEIDYKNKRTTIDINEALINRFILHEFLKEKCKCWSYENEYRWLIKLDECFRIKVNNSTCEYVEVDPDAIIRVDIGINVNDLYKDNILKVLKDQRFSNTEVKLAKIDDTEYKINYIDI
jgi:hypothetical protein